jgi:hypothetical protein
MPYTPVPWVGLAALPAMFLLSFLPDRLFEGSRTGKHWPHRHICDNRGAPWTDEHTCSLAERKPGTPAAGELRRLDPPVGPRMPPTCSAGRPSPRGWPRLRGPRDDPLLPPRHISMPDLPLVSNITIQA